MEGWEILINVKNTNILPEQLVSLEEMYEAILGGELDEFWEFKKPILATHITKQSFHEVYERSTK